VRGKDQQFLAPDSPYYTRALAINTANFEERDFRNQRLEKRSLRANFWRETLLLARWVGKIPEILWRHGREVGKIAVAGG
jgi:hypothetical protein